MTDDELRELGMKDFISESVVNCEITEEEEYTNDAGCDEQQPAFNEDEGGDNADDEMNPINGVDGHTTDECNNMENEAETRLENGENNDAVENGENNDAVENGEINDAVEYGENNDAVENGENNNAVENDDSNEAVDENDQKLNDDENKSEPNENLNENEPSDQENKTDLESEPVENKPKDCESKQKPITRPVSGHKFKIPAMWTPANPRANAAFVYTFFRHVSFTLRHKKRVKNKC